MVVGLCTIELRIEWSNSLKDKRREIKALLTRMRSKFNVSAAEVAAQDEWRRAVLAFAVVTTERRHADSILGQLLSFIEKNSETEVISFNTEIL